MFINKGLEDMIHHGLECSRGVGESKEHHCWFKDAKWCLECCFPLVSLFDLNIVIAPVNVEFSEDECMDQVSDCLLDIW